MLDNQKSKNIRILEIDPWLKPYEQDFIQRMEKYTNTKKALLGDLNSFGAFANGHLHFGFHVEKDGWYYREWAPEADALYLIGDFNGWNAEKNPLVRKEKGCWEIFLPGVDSLKHMSRVKVRVHSKGAVLDRIPIYIRRVIQDVNTYDFAGQIWNPPDAYKWKYSDFRIDRSKPLLIYEGHIGMAQEREGVGTYKEFTEKILPRIKAGNYNAVQLMAIMEHPYYASFGYQVSNLFAASSWFGTPEDLKELIDTAHSMGIAVLLDIVHSHASKNFAEGINAFDGTEYQFFHSGKKGEHPVWDSKLFNYAKPEVVYFLLSNIKFWLEEYHFDGFRFDGVASMLYDHHGIGVNFTDYSKYFNTGTDIDAVAYLQFANELIHELRPDAVTISEDMSGMPGMCLPIEYGGIGFDYRLSMGVPAYWINTLSKLSDEHWRMWNMWHELTTRRPQEKNIGYVESHDQAIVGDKTIIFWLADKEMYWHMSKLWDNIIIDRAISLHKMIRFITLTLAGEGYLNFMGNEFGHPEWIDFPREGNNWSHKYARRQWRLVDDDALRYQYLARFDSEMLTFVKSYRILGALDLRNLYVDEGEKLIAYKKGGLIFLFNFNPKRSFENYSVPIDEIGKYRVVFNSDEEIFGGYSRISMDVIYETKALPERENRDGITIYSPSRTVLVLKKM